MRLNIINNIATFTFKTNLKKLSYWSWFFIPISTSIMLLLILSLNKGASIISYKDIYINLLITFFILLIFMSFFFAPIIGNEIIDNKASKINEYLISIVRYGNVLFGKILGVFYLFLFTILVYSISLMIIIKNFKWIKVVFDNMFIYLKIFNVIGFLSSLLLGVFWIILLAAYISTFTKNRSHLTYSLIPIYFYVVLVTTLLLKIHLNHFIFILLSIFTPILSQMSSYSLMINGKLGILIYVISILVQMILMIFFSRIIYLRYKNLFKS